MAKVVLCTTDQFNEIWNKLPAALRDRTPLYNDGWFSLKMVIEGEEWYVFQAMELATPEQALAEAVKLGESWQTKSNPTA